jgi:hypothetical protein
MSDSVLFAGSGGREWLQGLLKEGNVIVTFTKSTGEERKMKCTLKEGVVPLYEKKTDRAKAKNDEVLSVWDLDKNEWRSFRLDSIKTVEFGIIDT